jgi:hypothetical protein
MLVKYFVNVSESKASGNVIGDKMELDLNKMLP